MNDWAGNLDDLVLRWGSLTESSVQSATKANVLLAGILGAIRQAMEWDAVELREKFLKLASDNERVYSRLEASFGTATVSSALRLTATHDMLRKNI